MERCEFRFVRQAMWIAVMAALAMSFGCNFESRSTAVESSAISGAMARPGRFNPTGASVCLQQMIKNPSSSFQVSFAEKSSGQDASSVEADVTPAGIDYTKHETSAGQTSTDTKHRARAKVTEMEVDFDLMKPVPWHGELVAAQDSAKSAGAGNVNGYKAIKYSIDTANEPAAQKATFLSLMAVKDYKIVGSAWVTTDTGCLVKYAIDFEQDGKNGSVKKTHFEGNVTKR